MYFFIFSLIFSIFWFNCFRFFYSIKRIHIRNENKPLIFTTLFFKLYNEKDWFKNVTKNLIQSNPFKIKNFKFNEAYIGDCEKAETTNRNAKIINIDDHLLCECSGIDLFDLKTFEWFFDQLNSNQLFDKKNQYHILNHNGNIDIIHQTQIQSKIKSSTKQEFIFLIKKNINDCVKSVLNHFKENYIEKEWKKKYYTIYNEHEEAEITTKRPLQIYVWTLDLDLNNLNPMEWINESLKKENKNEKINIKMPIEFYIMHPFQKISKHMESKKQFEHQPKIITQTNATISSKIIHFYFEMTTFKFINK